MRDVLARYWVVAHIALLAVVLSWAHGGTGVNSLTAIPWLSLIVLEMTLLLPPVRKTETPDLARMRVWRALVRDPLFYVGSLLCLYLLFQCLNGGRKLEFDLASNSWRFSLPPLSWGPFCVVPDESRPVFYGFLAAVVVLLGIRRGTNRRGKLILLRVLVANGGVLSLFGIVQRFGAMRLPGSSSLPNVCFTGFETVSQSGAFFTLLLAISIGLLVQALLAEGERKHASWLGVVLALNLTGALFSGSRAAILFSLALFVLGGLYAIRHAWRLVDSGVLLKVLAVYFLVLVSGVAFLFFLAPNNPILREIRTVPWDKLGEGTFGVRWLQTVSAWHIWREHPWFGVGGLGYRHYVCLELDETQRALLFRGGSHVYNDGLQFLVEHGVIGFGLMLGGVAILLKPIIQRLRLAHVTNVDGWTGEPWLLFRVSPITILILAGTTITFLASLIDLPFRSPAVLVTWCIALACAPAFLSSGAKPASDNQRIEPLS